MSDPFDRSDVEEPRRTRTFQPEQQPQAFWSGGHLMVVYTPMDDVPEE